MDCGKIGLPEAGRRRRNIESEEEKGQGDEGEYVEDTRQELPSPPEMFQISYHLLALPAYVAQEPLLWNAPLVVRQIRGFDEECRPWMRGPCVCRGCAKHRSEDHEIRAEAWSEDEN